MSNSFKVQTDCLHFYLNFPFDIYNMPQNLLIVLFFLYGREDGEENLKSEISVQKKFPTTSSKVYIVSINITSMECWRHNCKLSFFVISKRLSKGEGELIEVDAIKWFSLQCSAQLLYVIPWCTASIFTLYVRPVLLHTVLFEQRPIFLWSTMTFWLLTLCLLLDVIK